MSKILITGYQCGLDWAAGSDIAGWLCSLCLCPLFGHWHCPLWCHCRSIPYLCLLLCPYHDLYPWNQLQKLGWRCWRWHQKLFPMARRKANPRTLTDISLNSLILTDFDLWRRILIRSKLLINDYCTISLYHYCRTLLTSNFQKLNECDRLMTHDSWLIINLSSVNHHQTDISDRDQWLRGYGYAMFCLFTSESLSVWQTVVSGHSNKDESNGIRMSTRGPSGRWRWRWPYRQVQSSQASICQRASLQFAIFFPW